MAGILQEKFQVQYPPREAHSNEWASAESARTHKGLQTRSSSGNFESYRGDGYNRLPPGMNIEDQEVADVSGPAMSAGNLGNGSQVTTDVTAMSARTGFDRKALRPTDDEYFREHNDMFYESVVVDGVEGFVERGNVLDRS